MNIVDSLKKWFYTNNSSAASSDARVPLLNANGTPKGSDTMANLASVLGTTNLSLTTLIPKLAGNRTGQDANDLIETGWYYLYGANNQNSPDQYFFMHTINYGTLDVIQYGVGLVSSEIWVRGYTGTWSSWHKLSHDIPDFYKNYPNLGSLASALGIIHGHYYGSLKDLGLSIATYGFDARAYSMSCADAPNNQNDGFVLTGVTATGSENSFFQIATTDDNLYFRFYHGGVHIFMKDWTPMI